MPQKIAPQVKQLALQKLNAGMNAREVAELTGVSRRTIERWQSQRGQSASVPARTARQTTPPPHTTETGNAAPVPSDDESSANAPGGHVLDFQESPAPVTDRKSLVERGMAQLRGILGFGSPNEEDKPAAPVEAKLSPQQQRFVDNWSPVLSLGLIILATYVWGRIGPEYRGLAPDDKTAQKIMEPLIRIYARHAPMLVEMNPDVADAGASLFALFGYLQVSLSLYQKIKQEQLEYAATHGYEPAEPVQHNGLRAYRSAGAGGQNGFNGQGSGRNAVPGSGDVDAGAAGRDDWYEPPVGGRTLTPKEQSQLAALSRLAEQDYRSRARRSAQFR